MVILLVIVAILLFLFLSNNKKKENFKPHCHNTRCFTPPGFPKFQPPVDIQTYPTYPHFPLVPNTFKTIDTQRYKPVQWVSPNDTVIIEGHGGVGDISGVNLEFVKGVNGKVTFKTYTGI